MNKFKKGDKVRVTGTSAGNTMFGNGIVQNVTTTYATVRSEAGQTWTVNLPDLKHFNSEQRVAFISKFLTKEGQKLLKDEMIDVDIEPSDKMREEMEVLAVEAFLKDYKTKK